MGILRCFKAVVAITILLFLNACSSLPPQLASDNPNLVTQYNVWQSQLQLKPEVRLGGVIAKVTNLADKTRVEIVNLPIDSAGKPDIDLEPTGRFVAYFPGFVDPVALADGRLITVLGNATGSETSEVGEYQYQFPTMDVTGFRLWRVEERVVIYDRYSDFYPCYGIACNDIHFQPRQGRVIKDVR